MQKNVHIIGAGISGLSAAVRLANANYRVHVHEATQQAGGRCRSYFDAATNLTIDNGNHLLLSGNRHALAYARSIGTEAGLVGPKLAQFPFVDIMTGQRWQLDLGDGKLPLWVFDEARRVPDTRLLDYLALAPLVWAGTGKLEDVDDLVRIGAGVGLETDELRAAITEDRYAAVIDENRRAASSAGIDAIPAHIFGRRYLVMGAQPYDVLKQVVDRLTSPE